MIRTKQPTDEFEARLRIGYESGPGVRTQASVSGPISDTLKFRAAFSFFDTDGHIPNTFLGTETDPFQEISARVKLLWEPNGNFTADLRFSTNRVETAALYFNILDRFDFVPPFDGRNADDTSMEVRSNNLGINNRNLYNISLKMDYETDAGTLTSVTSYDLLEEILTGDAFDFLPVDESFFSIIELFPGAHAFGIFDINQSQFLDVKAFSQEIRFTSPADRKVRWIAGAYLVSTDRFISTGNMLDFGLGVFPVFREISTNPNNPQATFLADSQDNFAWALFADLSIDIGEQFELSLALRYKPNDDTTLFATYSRGFRGGGFNQAGVGVLAPLAGIVGVNDTFEAEVADTFEGGIKGRFLDGKLTASATAFHTMSDNSYFFVFLVTNSTQNLGNIDKVKYTGFELEVNARPMDGVDLYAGLGYTDSEVTKFPNDSALGNKVPLTTDYTVNLGIQVRKPLGVGTLDGFVRLDFQIIGDTNFWRADNTVTVRSPVELLDIRAGIQAETWSLIFWGKNITDKKYNTEFSPGGFVFKAQPARWGVNATKRF